MRLLVVFVGEFWALGAREETYVVDRKHVTFGVYLWSGVTYHSLPREASTSMKITQEMH